MGKNSMIKEELLRETETEILLKAFLFKINMFMGEEVASSILSTQNDMVDSLNVFTSKFQKKENNEIAFLLIKNAILSNEDNYFINVIKNKIAFGEYQDVLDLINLNLAFRKNLTKNLIHQSNITDKELFEKLNNKEHIIEDLDNIKFYEQVKQEKIKENLRLRSK